MRRLDHRHLTRLEIRHIPKYCDVCFGLFIGDDNKSSGVKAWRWGVQGTWVALMAASDGSITYTIANQTSLVSQQISIIQMPLVTCKKQRRETDPKTSSLMHPQSTSKITKQGRNFLDDSSLPPTPTKPPPAAQLPPLQTQLSINYSASSGNNFFLPASLSF